MGGWLENEFLKKTPSPKFGLESQLGTFDFGVCQFVLGKCVDVDDLTLVLCIWSASKGYRHNLINFQ